MSGVLGMCVLALLLAPWPARADELTLRDVIELHRSGLGEELLIAVIEADGGPFVLSFADIHDLKADGLGERVIAALVRTGRRSPAAVGDAPAVSVEQHVTNVVPGAVVVGAAVPYGADVVSSGDGTQRLRRGHADRRDGHRAPFDHRIEVPAATWITRQEDGRTVSPAAPVKAERPAAAWVTPNVPHPEPRRSPSADSPSHGEEDRRPSPPR